MNAAAVATAMAVGLGFADLTSRPVKPLRRDGLFVAAAAAAAAALIVFLAVAFGAGTVIYAGMLACGIGSLVTIAAAFGIALWKGSPE